MRKKNGIFLIFTFLINIYTSNASTVKVLFIGEDTASSTSLIQAMYNLLIESKNYKKLRYYEEIAPVALSKTGIKNYRFTASKPNCKDDFHFIELQAPFDDTSEEDRFTRVNNQLDRVFGNHHANEINMIIYILQNSEQKISNTGQYLLHQLQERLSFDETLAQRLTVFINHCSPETEITETLMSQFQENFSPSINNNHFIKANLTYIEKLKECSCYDKNKLPWHTFQNEKIFSETQIQFLLNKIYNQGIRANNQYHQYHSQVVYITSLFAQRYRFYRQITQLDQLVKKNEENLVQYQSILQELQQTSNLHNSTEAPPRGYLHAPDHTQTHMHQKNNLLRSILKNSALGTITGTLLAPGYGSVIGGIVGGVISLFNRNHVTKEIQYQQTQQLERPIKIDIANETDDTYPITDPLCAQSINAYTQKQEKIDKTLQCLRKEITTLQDQVKTNIQESVQATQRLMNHSLFNKLGIQYWLIIFKQKHPDQYQRGIDIETLNQIIKESMPTAE